jgi:hypothetical protein
VSTPEAKTPAELFDDFIKLEWQDMFRKEVRIRLDNGARYVPNGGSQGVQLLRKNVNAFDKAIRIWSGQTADPDSGTKGYDRIVDQAGIEYTWEWFLIDPTRPWAGAVPEEVRERIKADLERRKENAVTYAAARAEEDERENAEGDDDMIVSMNAERARKGKEPLNEQQEAMVRERRQTRRTES